MLGLFISLVLLIFIIETPALLRRQYYKELYVFISLLLIGFFMGLTIFFKWPLSEIFVVLTTYFESTLSVYSEFH